MWKVTPWLVVFLSASSIEAQMWSGRALELTKLDDEGRWEVRKEGTAFSATKRQLEFAIMATNVACTRLGYTFFRIVDRAAAMNGRSVMVRLETVPLPATPEVELTVEFSAESLEGSQECERISDPKLEAAIDKWVEKADRRWEKRRAKGNN